MNHPWILGGGTANTLVSLTQEQSCHAAGYRGERIRKIFLFSTWFKAIGLLLQFLSEASA